MPNIVIKKGFRLVVDSWENDADEPRTESMDFVNKEEALAVRDMAQEIFVSCNNGDGGIGNSQDNEDLEKTIINYITQNPKLAEINSVDVEDFEEVVEMVMEYNEALMGSSEWYGSRVFDDSSLFEIPDDMILKEI